MHSSMIGSGPELYIIYDKKGYIRKTKFIREIFTHTHTHTHTHLLASGYIY